jgi:hypothetical protein
MMRNSTLFKYNALFGIQTNGQQAHKQVLLILMQLNGVLLHGDGVQVDDGEEQLVMVTGFILQLHPLSQGA